MSDTPSFHCARSAGESKFVPEDRNVPFFTLYQQGQADADDIDDFIDDWHDSTDTGTRSLAEFLGMTDDEYQVWVMASATLPLLLCARQENRALRDVIASYAATLKGSPDIADRAVHRALTAWLRQPG
jgi:hypothetical protein